MSFSCNCALKYQTQNHLFIKLQKLFRQENGKIITKQMHVTAKIKIKDQTNACYSENKYKRQIII